MMRFIYKLNALIFMVYTSTTTAGMLVTGVSLTPNPLDVGKMATISVNGFIKATAPGQPDCTAIEIFFGDVLSHPSSDANKPASAYARLQPTQFPINISHLYNRAGSYTVQVTPVKEYQGKWYGCATGSTAELQVINDVIRSVKSISPAVAGQSTSIAVHGLGACSQNIQVNWGDGGSSSIKGPVNLQTGGVASHVYASAGTRSVTVQGSGCTGTASTSIGVGLFQNPTQGGADPMLRQKLHERLDRNIVLPAAPRPGANTESPAPLQPAAGMQLRQPPANKQLLEQPVLIPKP